MVERGRIGLIDFEGCGWDCYLHDVAVVQEEIEAESVEQAQVLRDALLHGYRKIRPLSADHESKQPIICLAYLIARLRANTACTRTLGEYQDYRGGSRRVF
jgi:Ser/Thr protein kinase RdoA (MazF antagonist)